MKAEQEDELLRSVALQNVRSILLARQRAEEELLRAQDELRLSRERLQAALSAADTGTFRWDIRTNALDCDENLDRLLGFPPGQGLRSLATFIATVHPDDRPAVIEACECAARDGLDFELEFRVVWPDGTVHWLADKGKTALDAEGRPMSMTGACIEVTRLKRADEVIREGAQRLQLALAAGQLGDWSWDAATDLVTLGERAANIFGLPVDTPISWTSMRDLLHEDHRERARRAVEDALSTRTNYAIEYPVRRPSGEDCWIAAHGRGTYTSAGAVLGMIGVVQDITARKDAEEALRQREALLRVTFEQAAVGIATARLDGRFLETNQRFADILGYEREELTQLSFRDVTHRDDAALTETEIRRLLAGESAHYSIEKRYLRKNGAVIWILATVTLIRDVTGHPLRFVGVIEDITRRRQTDDALRQAAEERRQLLESERFARSQAERMSATKDEFLAILSHELRTPLSAILGWSHMLRRRVSDDDLTKGLEIIERNARVQTQLIEDLLDMSRITSGKMRLDVQSVVPFEFIEAAVETVRPAAAAKGIRLEVLLDPTAGPVSGDASRLQQVVWNLLSNAIKFTPKDGRVQVLLERVDSHIEISVADTGAGIGPDFVEHVFERFRQADSSTTRKHGGLGLGLSIVKHLVELHGGTVHARSPGQGSGTTFTVKLPLSVVHRYDDGSRVHPAAPSMRATDFKALNLGNVRVLVVDDEPDARSLVARVLGECGAEVLSAASAEEALTIIERDKPQILISDIGMPNVDGFELLRRVRALGDARGGKLPAIALTAFARWEDRTRALSAGFLVHVSKPIEPSELVATVAAVAGRAGQPI